ncbi:cobalamin-binding protein [Candidatus Methanoplasma termitum]|uniref:BtuF protein n=1 Tax=Candidatus Methanoplasma termitum TaxID=1577791 RepID=A0A0A7LF60_9ARCH|nr:ABC transporter substrate-binding protein [Candidatus Methanoplasma termitum]AIZ56121.1 cobalamin-binding protein [Candidatus Methanoplasma termitum]
MKAQKLKLALSLVLIVFGAVSVPFFISDTNTAQPQASGFLIDFGDWNVTWTEMDMQTNQNPFDALSTACKENNFTSSIEDGTVKEINGVSSDGTYSWNLWTISKNSLTWVKESSPQNIDLSKYTIAAWAYTDGSGTPTVAVDNSGRSIYGYPQAQRTVTLAPAITEMIAALRAVETLVGTDMYSTYPASVVAGQNNGTIKILGDYLNPSFEQIVAAAPDMVFCDGSIYTHHIATDKLRNVGINTVLLYWGADVQEIMDNIYIVGVAIGYGMRALEVISTIEHAMDGVTGAISEHVNAQSVRVMLALTPDKSPWVSGSDTYVSDLTSIVNGDNVFSFLSGWSQVNSEQVISQNPSVIILLTTNYMSNQSDYDSMINSLSAEWRTTDAYKNGNIYLVTGAAGNMSTLPGPRFIQLMELTARILNPDIFNDIKMPKYIGDNYEDFLSFTKDLDFKN